jgi:aldehyde dehydrogenase (NAD+)
MTDPSPAAGPPGPHRPEPGSCDREMFFAGGSWKKAGGDQRLAVLDSGTENVLGMVRSGTPADVDLAVSAARAALPGWSALPPGVRAEHLRAVHAELSKRADDLTAVIAAEVGTAVRMAAAIQVSSALRLLELTASLLADQAFEEQVGNSLVVLRPVGVVAAITPWNYPLFQTVAKVAAALAAGCTVVHKPSELAPLSSFLLAEAAEAAALPPGVYNLVPGPGVSVGEAMASHPGVAMVSFTGSTAAGTRVYELAARSVKRVALELGGKSASVLLDDADLGPAVKASVNRAFLNSGQTCDAWTRLLVPRGRLTEVLDLATVSALRLTLGDQFDADTRLGPLVSAAQVARVRGYVDGAVGEGASAVLGGSAPPDGRDRGYYFRPTILVDVTPGMRVAREEVFGPVLAVLTYESEDEAAEIANDTPYGLSGAVWSGDPGHGMSFARRMEAGQVVINGGGFNPLAPFGGIKQSGIGRELGRYGIREFLETTALQL